MRLRPSLPPHHVALAVLVVTIWGANFALIDIGLEVFPPLLLACLRFSLVAACCLVVPRPRVALRWLLAVGLFTGTGEFGLLYIGMAEGMPGGLASLIVQAQVPFTILFAAAVLDERPEGRHAVGVGLSAVGLLLVGLARGRAGDGGAIPALAVVLVLGAAACWAVGNVCTRIAMPDNGFHLIVWSSLVPPLPLLGLSLLREGPHRDASALARAHASTWLALIGTAGLATILALGLWSTLLSRHPAERVVPFALAVPVVGFAVGWAVQGEPVGAATLGAAAVVLAGLALSVLGPGARTDGRRTGPEGAGPIAARLPRTAAAQAVDN
jgi:O-acetylserine/cysteine efflux transporter